jgi:peptide/nickel transport system substrate-binding protein
MPHDLIVALEGAPGSLDPHETNNLYSHAVIWPVCEPLFDVRPNGKLVPRLLDELPTANGRTYTFQLRQGVKFHDGQDFNADAVIANLNHAANHPSCRGWIIRDLVDFPNLKGSGHTVTIPLKYEKLDLLYVLLLTSPSTLGSQRPAGTGPFILQGGSGTQIRLAANAHYWGGKPSLSGIRFQIVRPSEVAEALLDGSVDFARTLDPASAALVLHSPKHQTRTVRPFGTFYMGFHCESELFKDVGVRRAFRDAIDVHKVEYDSGFEPAAAILPPGVEAHDPHLPLARHDRAGAKAVLQPRCQNIVVPLLFNEDSWYGRIVAHAIRDDLAKAGVAVDLTGIPGSNALVTEVLQRKTRPEPFLFVYNWYSIVPAAEVFLRPLFESGMLDNLAGYRGIDGILAAARKPMPSSDRIKLYRQAQEQLRQDVPVVFLGHPRVRVSAHGTDVSGIRPSSLNVHSFPDDRFLGVDVS